MASALAGAQRREFWIATWGQFLLFAGFSMFFQFPVFIKALGGTEARIGLIMGAAPVASTFLLPWVASLVDNANRKALMLAGGTVLAVTSLAAVLLVTPGPSMAVLMAVRGLGFVLYLIANGAHLARILPPAERAKWFGIYYAFWSVAAAIGPGLGEAVIERWGFPPFFAVSAGIVAAGSLLPLALRTEPAKGGSLWTNPLHGIAAFFRELLHPRLRWLFLALLLMAAGFAAIINFSATYLRLLGLSSGVFFAMYALTSVASRVWGGGLSDRVGRVVVTVPALVILTAGMALYSLVDGVWLLVVSGAIVGLGFGVANPSISAHMIDRVPPELQGIAVGGFQFAFNLGILISTPAMGALADSAGYRPMWNAAGALTGLAALIYLVGGRDRKG